MAGYYFYKGTYPLQLKRLKQKQKFWPSFEEGFQIGKFVYIYGQIVPGMTSHWKFTGDFLKTCRLFIRIVSQSRKV